MCAVFRILHNVLNAFKNDKVFPHSVFCVSCIVAIWLLLLGAVGTYRLAVTLSAAFVTGMDYKFNYRTDGPECRKSRVHKRAAHRLLRVCRHHGGVYNKLGQYVATLNHGKNAYIIDAQRLLSCLLPFIDTVHKVFVFSLYLCSSSRRVYDKSGGAHRQCAQRSLE